MDFSINLPRSRRPTQAANIQQSPVQQAGQYQHHPPSIHELQSNRQTPISQQHSTGQSSPLQLQQNTDLSTDQKQKVQECLWLLGSSLGVQLNIEAIIEEVEIVEDGHSEGEGGGLIEQGENGQVKGIYIVDSGELQIMAGDQNNMHVVTEILRPGNFCGELSTLFEVPQTIETKSQTERCLIPNLHLFFKNAII